MFFSFFRQNVTSAKENLTYNKARRIILKSEEQQSRTTTTISTKEGSNIKINYRKTFQGICGKFRVCDSVISKLAIFAGKFLSGCVGGKMNKLFLKEKLVPFFHLCYQ